MSLTQELDDPQERVPDKYFALDHIIVRTPSVEDSLRWAEEHGFQAIDGGKHDHGLTANVLIPLADGVYIELISFLDSGDAEKKKEHWWWLKKEGVIDWAVTNEEQERHLSSIGGSDAYKDSIEGGRTTKDGKELRWVTTFPAHPPRGRLPFFCDDRTPREWRVPAAPKHPNGAIGIKQILIMSKPTRLSALHNPLVAVLGRASEEPMGTSSDKRPTQYPPRERILYLSTPEQPKHKGVEILLRDASSEQEMAWVAKQGECIYEVQVACEGRKELGDSLKGMSGLRLAPAA